MRAEVDQYPLLPMWIAGVGPRHPHRVVADADPASGQRRSGRNNVRRVRRNRVGMGEPRKSGGIDQTLRSHHPLLRRVEADIQQGNPADMARTRALSLS